MDTARNQAKKIPISAPDQLKYCDIVSSKVWTYYPWFRSKTTIAPGLIPLVDLIQDYSSPPNLYRLTKGSLVRTDTTPDEHRELDVMQELDVDMIARTPYAIRAISMQAAVGQLRLESAVTVPSGTTWEIRGEYQINPNKVTALTDPMWMDDQYFDIAVAGILYWLYKQSDDPRAGTAAMSPNGQIQYSGQLAEFWAFVNIMKASEDLSGIDGVFPGEPMGVGRDSTGLNIFGF